MPTPDFVCQFECDSTDQWTLEGSATLSTSSPLQGSKSLYVSSEASVAHSLGKWSGGLLIYRYRVKFDTLPAGNIDLDSPYTAWGGAHFKQSDSKIYAEANGTTGATGVSVTTGVEYVIDVRVDTRINPWYVDVRVNGTACGQATAAQGDVTIAQTIGIGFLGTGTGSGAARFDDFVVSTQAGDYPIGTWTAPAENAVKHPVFYCTFEDTHPVDHWEANGSGAAVSTNNPITGGHSLRCNTSATSGYFYNWTDFGVGVWVHRYRIRFDSFPAVDCQLDDIRSYYGGAIFNATDHKIYACLSGAYRGSTGIEVTTGVEYLIDVRVDLRTNAAHTCDVKVNGVAVGRANRDGSAITAASCVGVGLFATCTADVYFDDFLESEHPEDFPLGDYNPLPTAQLVCNFECEETLHFTLYGGASLTATNPLTGKRSLFCNPTASDQFAQFPNSGAGVWVAKFRVKYDSLPTTNHRLFLVNDANDYGACVWFKASDSKIYAGAASGMGTTGVSIAAGNTYLIDVRVDRTANPWLIDVQVDGSACAQYSDARPADNQGEQFWLSDPSGTHTYVARYDDFVLSHNPDDYPIGDWPTTNEVAYDNATYDSTQGLSSETVVLSHSRAALVDGYALVVVGGWDTDTQISVTSITYDGVSLSKLAHVYYNETAWDMIELWGAPLGDRSSGTHDCTIVLNAAWDCFGGGIMTFSNVHQTDSVRTPSIFRGTESGTLTGSTPSNATELVVDGMLYSGGGITSVATTQTGQLKKFGATGDVETVAGSIRGGLLNSTQMGWQLVGNNPWILNLIALALKPSVISEEPPAYPPSLFRGRNAFLFDDEELNRFEFWPARAPSAGRVPRSGSLSEPFII